MSEHDSDRVECAVCARPLDGVLAEITAERDRYRAALVSIADENSGRWGWIAHEALHPERARADR